MISSKVTLSVLLIIALGFVIVCSGIKVGDDCTGDADACKVLGEGAECDRTCYCNYTVSVGNEDKTKCLPIVREFGKPCEENLQCIFEISGLAICDTSLTPPVCNHTCKCDAGSVEDPNDAATVKCRTIIDHIGERCHFDEQCKSGKLGRRSVCIEPPDTDNKTYCQCGPDAVLDITKEFGEQDCVAKITTFNATCYLEGHCGVPNTECIVPPEMLGEKRCRCKPGEFVESVKTPGTCVPVRHSVGTGEGAKCETDIQCTVGLGVNSTCEGKPEGHCKCVGPNGFYGKMCHDASVLNGKCEGDVNCFAGINTLAECRAKRCKCRKNAVEGDDRLCYEPRILGGACETNAICEANIGNGVECKSRKCTCKEDREATEDGKKCNGAMTFVANTIFILGALLIKNMF